jgi:peroxiredoxin
MTLSVGDVAPDWTLSAWTGGSSIATLSLKDVLARHNALVIVTYALDFTGG